MTLEIKAMNETHLDAAYALTQQLKWPHRRADWQQALLLGEGLAAQEHGTLVGTLLFWRWGKDYATLGLVIVDDAQQHRIDNPCGHYFSSSMFDLSSNLPAVQR